ncbi:MAG: helicase C-terminal domain-containing protein [Thermoanaerobaculia bacterium]
MAPRFDFERLSIELGVADLVEQRLLRSIGFAQRGGYERLWLGQAIHSRYQERSLAEDPTYQREVVVSHSFHHRGWEIRVLGRIDGLRRDAEGRLVVEEIKSVRRGAELSPGVRELYERQAQIYAWMLAHRDGVEVGAELVLIEIGGEATDRASLVVDLEAIESEVLRRAGALVRGAEEELARSLARREAGERLSFPYAELRPGQQEILAAVETALAHREHVLIEAPTGIGKTVAALFPALAYALRTSKRLYVLTAKTLQQDMANKVLKLLNQERAFHSLRLRAKAKMCANDQLLCHEEYCRFARDYALKVLSTGILDRLLDEQAQLEPDDIFRRSKELEVCPFEVSLELAGRAEVVVGDYNYAFEPHVALSEFGPEGDLSDAILILDEVHNLVDRGRGYYSPSLASRQVRRVADAIGLGGELIHLRISALAGRLAELIEAAVDEALEDLDGLARPGAPVAREGALPEEDLWRLRPLFDDAFVDYLEHRRETRSFAPEDPFVELYFAFQRFLEGLLVSDSSFSHYLEREGEDRRIKILCRDPSRFLGKVINKAHSVIGLSATLSPPDFYRDLLGFEAGRTAAVSVPCPFPLENRRIVIDPAVATRYQEREANFGVIAEHLAAFADAVPGNCLGLFPSYQFLAEVASRMPPTAKRLLVQGRADSDQAREEILEHLRQAVFGDILLLAVAGGVFAEGVDYPGDMLRGVAVVGPCLPALTLEQQLLRDYYEERFERGFEYAFVVPGMTRVVQAAGRLIRSAEDRGVIALLDRRFLTRPYSSYLPADWVPEEGLRALTGNPARAAAEFFRWLR